MLARRTFLLTPLTASLAHVVSAQSAAPGKMLLSMHQNTSAAAGYRGSLEGWARAGIRHVELGAPQLNGFLEGDTLPAARRLLTDLGLTPVSAAVVLQDIWLPGPARTASLGDDRIYSHVDSSRDTDVRTRHDSGGGASQRQTHARLFPLLVWPE